MGDENIQYFMWCWRILINTTHVDPREDAVGLPVGAPRPRRGGSQGQVHPPPRRNHGYHFMYDRAQNGLERIEMTYR